MPGGNSADAASSSQPLNNAATGDTANAVGDYDSNTSLEEISDWLTKIIVGVGLVQAQQIGRALGEAGRAVGVGIFQQPETGYTAEVIGVATILAFAVLGFLAAFLWFRQNLIIAWTQSHREPPAVSERRLRTAPHERVQSVTIAPALASMPATPDLTEFDALTSDPKAADLKKAALTKYDALRADAKHPDDWAKDMFGGLSTRRTPKRVLGATVKPVRGVDRFEVVATITTDPAETGAVVFFLHNTFPDPTPVVQLDKNGTATLTVYCWGAFTVGVLMDGGTTELELDLSLLPDAPQLFRDR